MDAPDLLTRRTRMTGFTEADLPALAAILADPDVSKGITADAAGPEKALMSARSRTGGYLESWAKRGYGAWAVRSIDAALAPPGTLLGWCGFSPPDQGDAPELVYGFSPLCWGQKLAVETASAALDWLFQEACRPAAAAALFRRINPASAAVLAKLGMQRDGTIPIPVFFPDLTFARQILDYEIWRMGDAPSRTPEKVLFEAAYKGGQIASLFSDERQSLLLAFQAAARKRPDCPSLAPEDRDAPVALAFGQGFDDPSLDWFGLTREAWAR